MSTELKNLERDLARWRADRRDAAALSVEKWGAIVAKQYNHSEWDLARFDNCTLPLVIAWLQTAGDDLVLPCLRHLRTVLPDPRATPALLTLLGRSWARPIERATVVARLRENADPRELRLAEALGLSEAYAAA